MRRPTCVHCGSRYGQRSTSTILLKHKVGETPPTYTGDGTVTREHGRPLPDGTCVVYREVWDGKSWTGGYHPFCTLRCALSYARIAFRTAGLKRVV